MTNLKDFIWHDYISLDSITISITNAVRGYSILISLMEKVYPICRHSSLKPASFYHPNLAYEVSLSYYTLVNMKLEFLAAKQAIHSVISRTHWLTHWLSNS
jgi:hypothetical protein